VNELQPLTLTLTAENLPTLPAVKGRLFLSVRHGVRGLVDGQFSLQSRWIAWGA
jgi:hypothetical protein